MNTPRLRAFYILTNFNRKFKPFSTLYCHFVKFFTISIFFLPISGILYKITNYHKHTWYFTIRALLFIVRNILIW